MNSSIYNLLLALLWLHLVACQKNVETLKIPEGYVAMFGYGSLMSKSFIETSLVAKNYNGPFLPAYLKGYERSWTFAWPTEFPLYNVDSTFSKDYILVEGDTIYPKYLHYLNIREDQNSLINGVLYVVPKADLPLYDAWELGYERFEVTDLIEGYAVEGGPVFAYKALPDFTLEPDDDYRQHVVDSGYWQIIEEAFAFWGEEFQADYEKSTQPFDPTILRKTHKIPWIDPPMEKVKELKAKFKY